MFIIQFHILLCGVSVQCFACFYWVICPVNLCVHQGHEDFLIKFSSGIFMVMDFMLKSVIHIELIFMYGMR